MAAPSPSLAKPSPSHAALKLRLHRYFSYYEPSQLSVLDQWISNWGGREELLMASLVAFHGAEPPATYTSSSDRPDHVLSQRQLVLRETRSLLQQCVLFYCPHEIAMVDMIMKRWETNEDLLFKKLEELSGKRDKIFRWFQRFDPTQMEYAVQLAREWIGQEHHLLAYLEEYNGKVPLRPLAFPILLLPDSEKTSIARSRLTAFFREHQPQKLKDVDAILEAFKGKETEMFGMLTAKYGDVPAEKNGGKCVPISVEQVPIVSTDFSMAVKILAECWLPSDEALDKVDSLLSQLLGSEISNAEVLVRLAEEVQVNAGGARGESKE